MSSSSAVNMAARKYAREITGFAPADDESYVSAYNHFKAGYSSRDKEVEELKQQILDKDKENERLRELLKSSLGMWQIANRAHYERNSDAVEKFKSALIPQAQPNN